MKKFPLAALVSALLLATLGCDGNSDLINGGLGGGGGGGGGQGGGSIELLVTGSFVPPVDGGVIEVRLLLDGVEVPGSRETCPSTVGCTGLVAYGMVNANPGRHVLSLVLVEHTRDLDPYSGSLSYQVRPTALVGSGAFPDWEWDEPFTRVTLAPGDSADFEFDLQL